MSGLRRIVGLTTSALLPVALLVACAGEEPPAPPDAVPTTLSARPTPRPQPTARIVEASAPRVVTAGGISAGATDVVWEQALDLLRNWVLNPEHMQRHAVRDPGELDALGRLMTPEARARWRKIAHRVTEGYLNPGPRWRDRKARLQSHVHQLVVWNLELTPSRAWDNPMLGPVTVSDGSVMGADGRLRTILRIRTSYRLVGNGEHHRLPLESVLGLVWEQQGDAWLLDEWWRTATYGKERQVGGRKGGPSSSPSSSPTPEPDRSTRDPRDPQVDPTLVPE